MSLGHRAFAKMVTSVFATRNLIEDLAPGTPEWRVADSCIALDLDPAEVFKVLDSRDFFPREDES